MTQLLHRLLSPADVAEYLNVTVRNLEEWRRVGTGPAFLVLGHRTVRYRKSAIDSWLRARRVIGSADR